MKNYSYICKSSFEIIFSYTHHSLKLNNIIPDRLYLKTLNLDALSLEFFHLLKIGFSVREFYP